MKVGDIVEGLFLYSDRKFKFFFLGIRNYIMVLKEKIDMILFFK